MDPATFKSHLASVPVKVAIHLEDEESDTCDDQKPVDDPVKTVVARPSAPTRNNEHNGNERQYLPQLHAYVETDDLAQKHALAEIERLEAGGQAKAVDETEHKDH